MRRFYQPPQEIRDYLAARAQQLRPRISRTEVDPEMTVGLSHQIDEINWRIAGLMAEEVNLKSSEQLVNSQIETLKGQQRGIKDDRRRVRSELSTENKNLKRIRRIGRAVLTLGRAEAPSDSDQSVDQETEPVDQQLPEPVET